MPFQCCVDVDALMLCVWCPVGVVVVVAIAGVMSGLTLGLLSMDRLDLELMLRTGSKKQERFARRYADGELVVVAKLTQACGVVSTL